MRLEPSKIGRPRVVMARVIPIGDLERLGVLSENGFNFWNAQRKEWSGLYKRTEVRGVKDATAAQLAASGATLGTWLRADAAARLR